MRRAIIPSMASRAAAGSDDRCGDIAEGLLKASDGQELPLKISADGQTPHQAVVTVLEVAANWV